LENLGANRRITLIGPPDGFGRIPILPFLVICSYLTPEVIYTRLASVCTHFAGLIRDNEVPVSCLHISHPGTTELKLLTLRRKVSRCSTIYINKNLRKHHNTKFWNKLLGWLLYQLKDSVRRVDCQSEWFPEILKFVDKSTTLVSGNVLLTVKANFMSEYRGNLLENAILEIFRLDRDRKRKIINSFKIGNGLNHNWWLIKRLRLLDCTLVTETCLVDFRSPQELLDGKFERWDSLSIQIFDLTELHRMSITLPRLSELGSLTVLITREIFFASQERIDINSPGQNLQKLFKTIEETRFLRCLNINTVGFNKNDSIFQLLKGLIEKIPRRIQETFVDNRNTNRMS
jgi:hypothetical protein